MPDTHHSAANGHEDSTPDPVRNTSSSSHEYAPIARTSSRSPSPKPEPESLPEPTEEPKPSTPATQHLVTTQPSKTQDLSVAEAAPPPDFIADLKRRHRANGFQRFLFSLNHGCNSTIYNILLVIFIALFYWLPAGIFIICAGCLFLALSFGFSAANGTIALVLGNSILRATHHAHYTDNASAAAIGAVGGILALLCMTALFNFIQFPADEQGRAPIFITWPITTLTMTLAGVIGVSLLKRHHVDIGDIDLVHGARAGALGGTLLGPIAFLAGPAIMLVLGILLSPLWLAMSLGFRWAYGRSSESWRGHTYRSSHCYTYGSCGDDQDIEDEVYNFQQRGVENRPFY